MCTICHISKECRISPPFFRLHRCRSEFLTRGRSEYLNRYKPQPVAKSNHFDQVSDWFHKKLRSSFRIPAMQKYSLKRRRKRPDQPVARKELVGSCEYSVVQKSLLRCKTPHESIIEVNPNKGVRSGRVRTKNLDADKDTNIDAKTGDRQNERTMFYEATPQQKSNREDQQTLGPEINTLSTLFEIHFHDVVNTLSRLEQSTNEKNRNVC